MCGGNKTSQYKCEVDRIMSICDQSNIQSLSWKRLITKCVQVSTNYRVRKRFVRFFCKYLQNDLQGKEKKSWNHMFISQEQSNWKLSNKSRHHNCELTTYVLLVTHVYIMHTIYRWRNPKKFQRNLQQSVTKFSYKQINECRKYPLEMINEFL